MRWGRSGSRAYAQAIGAILALLGAAIPIGPARAQRPATPTGDPSPRVLVVMPGGGRAGETVEVTVTGIDLDEPSGLLFSHPGFEATPLGAGPAPVIPPGDARLRTAFGLVNAMVSRRFRVAIPAGAPPGLHDLRLVSKWGVSNPRAFVVGDLAEAVEKEPNDDVAQAQRIALNSTFNGAISTPIDVDDVVFAGTKGRRVVVSGLASSIDSRLLMGLELYDGSGKRLGASHEYRGTDALLDAVLPADGDYLVRIFAFSYALGGPECSYRVTVSTAPWIDAVFPPVVEPGKPARVTVFGRNLPGGRPDPASVVEGRVLERLDTTIDVPGDPKATRSLTFLGHLPPAASLLDGFEFRLRNDAGVSNPALLTLSRGPVVLDLGGNESPATAQEIIPPSEIAGRIEARRDRDWYTFAARKGDVYSIEASAARLGAPLDLYFALRDPATGKILGEFDQGPGASLAGRGQGGRMADPALLQFYTATDDPDRDRFVVPADGRYQLLVSSREASSRADPRHVYRVRVGPERPDFRLVVMPASKTAPDAAVVPVGGRVEASVFAWRIDGFDGAITLGAEDLPEGVTCTGRVLGAGQSQGAMVFTASDDAAIWEGPIAVTGTATIDGQTVVHEARAATISWPVPVAQGRPAVPALSRLDRGIVLAVRAAAPFRLSAGMTEATARPGEKVTIPLTLDRLAPDFKGPVQVKAEGLPAPFVSSPITIAAGAVAAQSVIEIAPGVPPGVYTLLFRAEGQGPPRKNPVVQPTEPITLTILPRNRPR